MEDDVFEVTCIALQLKNVCWVYKDRDRRETELRVCKDDGKRSGVSDLLVGRGCVEVEALLSGRDGVLKCKLEDGRVGEKEMSSSALC